MPNPQALRASIAGDIFNRRIAMPLVIVLLQFIAALYFVYDGVIDLIEQAQKGLNQELAMECLAALALLGGTVMGSLYIRRMVGELHHKDQALAAARAALADHIALRFEEWKLTPGEGEVALFALKGCNIAEIARLRGAAAGTVRSQLSQIYAKAGVNSQAMLASLFIEDLLEPEPAA
jgi:DNA-binding CsgD family transcriptional regulator